MDCPLALYNLFQYKVLLLRKDQFTDVIIIFYGMIDGEFGTNFFCHNYSVLFHLFNFHSHFVEIFFSTFFYNGYSLFSCLSISWRTKLLTPWQTLTPLCIQFTSTSQKSMFGPEVSAQSSLKLNSIVYPSKCAKLTSIKFIWIHISPNPLISRVKQHLEGSFGVDVCPHVCHTFRPKCLCYPRGIKAQDVGIGLNLIYTTQASNIS